jgi:predicted AlkP superfamily pyrophosphatase or phosphodiesterase
MRRLTLAAFTLLLAVPLAPTGAEPQRRVVLISVDGLMPSSYVRPDELGLRVPNLRKLAAKGAWARGVQGVLPTVTYPSHTTLVTGVPPRLHGITSNRAFDPEGRSNEAWRWYAGEIRVPSLLTAARARTLATAPFPIP